MDRIPRPTKTYHTSSYASIFPSRLELSLKGKSVLITGGASGIGLETSKAFAAAGASRIVILARSQGRMDKAKIQIESKYPGTSVGTHSASIADFDKVDEILKNIGTIDILVLNAAALYPPKTTLDSTPQEATELFAANVIGPLNLIKAFMALPPRTEQASRTIIYTSSAGVYDTMMPGVGVYSASKAAMTYLMRYIDSEFKETSLRTFSFHPAFAFTPMARDVLGLKEDQFPYDSLDLPASFAVWLCSSEADFLKGRFLWSHWDIDELKAKKDLITNDPSQLTIGLVQDKLVE